MIFLRKILYNFTFYIVFLMLYMLHLIQIPQVKVPHVQLMPNPAMHYTCASNLVSTMSTEALQFPPFPHSDWDIQIASISLNQSNDDILELPLNRQPRMNNMYLHVSWVFHWNPQIVVQITIASNESCLGFYQAFSISPMHSKRNKCNQLWKIREIKNDLTMCFCSRFLSKPAFISLTW